MRIHKAGIGVLLVAAGIFSLIVSLLAIIHVNSIVLYSLSTGLAILLLFMLWFFRNPKRKITINENQVIAPADGKIVVIEEIFEDEYIKDKCIQISIFMSIWNVHINWMPVLGKVLQTLHFNGRYMAAWLPKASTENERSVILIETKSAGKILVKQIAGALARRIITYVKQNDSIMAGDQLGFIRFGSRVDVLIPVNSNVKVNLNDKVTGGKTLLAEFSK